MSQQTRLHSPRRPDQLWGISPYSGRDYIEMKAPDSIKMVLALRRLHPNLMT